MFFFYRDPASNDRFHINLNHVIKIIVQPRLDAKPTHRVTFWHGPDFHTVAQLTPDEVQILTNVCERTLPAGLSSLPLADPLNSAIG